MRYFLIITVTALGCSDNVTPVPEGQDETTFDCLPNLDGIIEEAELPVALQRTTSYLLDYETRVDLAGTDSGEGLLWQFDGVPESGTSFTPAPLAGTALAGAFPGAEFSLALEAVIDMPTLGIYSVNEEGLWLHGFVSTPINGAVEDSSLRYSSPVALLRFPLQSGSTWTEVGRIDDTFLGAPIVRDDTYEVEVVADGTVELPGARLGPSLRVSTRVTTDPLGGQATITRQDSFYFECFGEVVRARSRPGDDVRDFTTASSLYRLDL